MHNFVFKSPWLLLLILLVPLIVYLAKKKKGSTIVFSSTGLLSSFRPTLKIYLKKNIIYLRAAAIILFIVALAGPRRLHQESYIEAEGVDIVLAIDSSGSMLAEDFVIDGKRKNRLEVVKKVAEEFIAGRPADRIGLITFAASAYTVCPLTLDHDWLLENLKRIEIGAIEDGTAIGSAISSSLNRLADVKAKSKIIILLTDGVNNMGKISPDTAAQAAKALGVKIYTIGVGKKGPVPYPVKDIWGRQVYRKVDIDIDEDSLKNIAGITGAKYFRATDTESLRAIYKEIDSLEKTTIEEKGFRQYNELFHVPLTIALILLLAEVILANTWLRQIP